MNRDFMWPQLQHEIDRLVLILERTWQAIDPAGFNSQSSLQSSVDPMPDLSLGHPFPGIFQDLFGPRLHPKINSLAAGFCHCGGDNSIDAVRAHLPDPTDSQPPGCAALTELTNVLFS